jgi:hypothetical protein
MKRGSVVVVILLALAMAGPLTPGVVAADTRAAPKVVLIVGPVGAATDGYRRLAEEAAVAAARYTPNVVRLYSPDATWSAVRQALQGASIVLYLGHGNGWPSRYSNSLYPVSQDGLGLNPTAGASGSHQYFGEDVIGREVRLAKHAVVLLSHLCYASGNSEPGLEEGPLGVGQQRVDNYAAGFIRAGADAVIADSYLRPEYYVRSILAGKGTVDRIWRTAPSFKGNLLQFASTRSKGYIDQMDTDTPTQGFHRSIVLRAGLAAANVLASATRIVDGFQPAPAPWASPAPSATPDPALDAGPVDLVSPEVPGEIVAPVAAKRTANGLSVPVKVPTVPGLYRLVATIHEADGVAYDAASQALIPALIVRVTGRLTAMYDAPGVVTAGAGKRLQLRVKVTNLGSTPWGSAALTPTRDGAELVPARRATLVARWVALANGSAAGPIPADSTSLLAPGLASRESATVVLDVTAPALPGEYLVLIDVVVPGTGSLAIAGVPPALVRVSVGGAPSQTAP